MGRSYVEGVQGADLRGSSFTCAATMKHFIGYSNSRTGQDRTPVWLPDNVLLQYYLPPFEAAVRAGVATAMEAYTELNGEPVVGSHKYLTRLLRGHLRFAGVCRRTQGVGAGPGLPLWGLCEAWRVLCPH